MNNTEIPVIGDIVHVRQRKYLVQDIEHDDDVTKSDPLTLVHLNCIEEDAQGEELSVLWQKEIDRRIETDSGWKDVGKKGFDPRELYAAYFHILRWNCVTATDHKLFQSPFRAGISIEPFQLEPLAKALEMPRVNLFIADDVGLGKTIEAGLIVSELMLRKKVRDVVVACPPSMTYQWKDELQQRFGLDFKIIDREFILKMRQERGYGVNPWNTHNKFIISHRLLIDDTYTSDLRAWLGNLRKGSMLILDEAHHAAPSSDSVYAVDTQFTKAMRDISHSFEHRLFLSATPHNGHTNSFAALLEILDPQRFHRGFEPDKELLEEVMVRRLKDDIRQIQGGFPKREIEKISIDNLKDDHPELVLSEMLDKYRELTEEILKELPKGKRNSFNLLITNLQKRLLSSIPAFERTLRTHKRSALKRFEEHRKMSEADAKILRDSVDQDSEFAELEMEAIEGEFDNAVEDVSVETLKEVDETGFKKLSTYLEKMYDLAAKSAGIQDSKIKYILNWINENMKSSDGSWNHKRLIIFTEWEDTLRYIRDQLHREHEDSDQIIKIFQGSTSKDERQEIKRLFNLPPEESQVRILIASDAAREGLNLQAYCNNLFHYDIPWNPARMEQRNGRIDRKLQPEEKVYCRYFVYEQRPEDRVLQVLIEKTKRIQNELGSLSTVLNEEVESTIGQGIRRKNIETQVQDIGNDKTLNALKKKYGRSINSLRNLDKLKERLSKLKGRVDSSMTEIALNSENLKSAINMGLNLIDASKLNDFNHEKGYKAYEVPEIHNMPGKDDTWIQTMDSLRPLKEKGQKIDRWRRDTNLRPVVFDSPEVLDESVVHLHLEHKLVKRLLSRFSSQGFKYHELSRTCFVQNKDSVKRVILLGKLCLFGKDALRLHEEIIAVSARWIEPSKRKNGLKQYEQKTEKKTIDMLEESLISALSSEEKVLSDSYFVDVSEFIEKDIEDLKPLLLEKGEEQAKIAKDMLKKRSKSEQDAIIRILSSQKQRIEDELTKIDNPEQNVEQLSLFNLLDEQVQLNMFSDKEKKQRFKDIDSMRARIEQIQKEIEVEPGRISETYQVVTEPRVEPVGLIYLMPEGK